MENIKLNIDKGFNWGAKNNGPVIISGPCSAETEKQVIKTCEDISGFGVTMLRAGIWKPRTRPDSFEGAGSIGLKWIKEAGRRTGLPVTVEVANAKHVEEALKAGIDILWIGARTTVSPFAVQEIADALSGSDIPVMVKNPVNPELQLWIGALERLNRAGITKLAAIHRGFSCYGYKKYRNRPYWQIPSELKKSIPGIKVICDPSHMGGKREFILSLAQKALDFGFDGLMIESHIDPANALSDSAQQLKPHELGEVLNKLVFKKPNVENGDFNVQMEYLREKMELVNEEIINLLSGKSGISKEIAAYGEINGNAEINYNSHNTLSGYSRCGSLWSKGYFVSTIGKVSEETIRKYIQEQKIESK